MLIETHAMSLMKSRKQLQSVYILCFHSRKILRSKDVPTLFQKTNFAAQ